MNILNKSSENEIIALFLNEEMNSERYENKYYTQE
jgi:hypothetical protein